MNQLVANGRDQRSENAENGDANDGVGKAEHEIDGLTRQYGTRRRKAQIHQNAHQQRQGCAFDTELHATGDHLRQSQTRPLSRVQSHHNTAQDIADQQTDDGRHGLGTEHHSQSPVDHRSDLHIGTKPEGELTERRAMTLALRNHVNGPGLYASSRCWRCGIYAHRRTLQITACCCGCQTHPYN